MSPYTAWNKTWALRIPQKACAAGTTRSRSTPMNPLIRGWSTYFRTGVSKEVFAALDGFMYRRAQRYMQRRHPRKSRWWRTQKYWGRVSGRQDRWVFQDKERHGTLRKFAWTTIIRHRLVPSTYSPDDPTLQDYWSQRRQRTHVTPGRSEQLARLLSPARK